MSKWQRLLFGLVALALVAAAAAASRGRPVHYALDPLRDCLALRGGLVTALPVAAASEGIATLDVSGDTALLAFGRDAREAATLEASLMDATRYGNLVVAAGTPGPFGSGGELAVQSVRRCLSDGQGPASDGPHGFRYPPEAIATFDRACRRVGASQAQCRCVLTGAQAQLSLADFKLATEGGTLLEEAWIETILDGCRLVG